MACIPSGKYSTIFGNCLPVLPNTQCRPLIVIFARKHFQDNQKNTKSHEKLQRHRYYVLPCAE